jgi:hypothetical protein
MRFKGEKNCIFYEMFYTYSQTGMKFCPVRRRFQEVAKDLCWKRKGAVLLKVPVLSDALNSGLRSIVSMVDQVLLHCR